MKHLLTTVVLGLLIISVPAMAQSDRAQKRAEKKERKLAREAEKKAEMENIYELVQNKNFVIDADFLYDKYSRQYIATNHNFVAVEGDRIVLQTASPAGFGANGIGGVTMIGKIHDYEVRKGKKGETIYVTAQMTTNFASSGTVFFRISGKESASARVYGPWGRGIEFSGNFEVPEKSFRYQGQSIPL